MPRQTISYLDEFENREYPRFACSQSIELLLPHAGRSWRLMMTEISQNGFRLETENRDLPILPGTLIKIIGEADSFFINAKVIFLDFTSAGNSVIGAKICENEEADVALWVDFVKTSGRNQTPL